MFLMHMLLFQLSYAREIVIFNSSVYTCSGLVVGVTHTLYFYTEAGSLLLIKHVPVGSFNFTFSSLVDGYVYLSICFMDPPTGGYGVVEPTDNTSEYSSSLNNACSHVYI